MPASSVSIRLGQMHVSAYCAVSGMVQGGGDDGDVEEVEVGSDGSKLQPQPRIRAAASLLKLLVLIKEERLFPNRLESVYLVEYQRVCLNE
jgi:hypothetical protein